MNAETKTARAGPAGSGAPRAGERHTHIMQPAADDGKQLDCRALLCAAIEVLAEHHAFPLSTSPRMIARQTDLRRFLDEEEVRLRRKEMHL